MSADELVLAIPSSALQGAGYFQGIAVDAGRYLRSFADEKAFRFLRRSFAETDETHKQLVTYVLLCCDDQIFTYRRGRASSEARLLGLSSLGVGGHVSDVDPNLFSSTIAAAFHRELFEEVAIASPFRGRLVGLINDDTTPVGRVHLGLVYLVRLLQPQVRPRERKLTAPRFERLSSIAARYDTFENWSRLCLSSFSLLQSEFHRPSCADEDDFLLSSSRGCPQMQSG